MPAPTLGQFGYVRLLRQSQLREVWEEQYQPEYRYLLAAIRYAQPMPRMFEGESPANPGLMVGSPPDLRFAYVMPNRILLLHDQGSVHQFERRTAWVARDQSDRGVALTWPGLFAWVAWEKGQR